MPRAAAGEAYQCVPPRPAVPLAVRVAHGCLFFAATALAMAGDQSAQCRAGTSNARMKTTTPGVSATRPEPHSRPAGATDADVHPSLQGSRPAARVWRAE